LEIKNSNSIENEKTVLAEIKKELTLSKMTKGDLILLKIYVKEYLTWLKCWEVMDTDGYTNQYDQVRPEFTVMKNCEDKMMKISKMLGLDTFSRSKFGIVQENNEDEFKPV
jgi:P27 family predicted phage terminase small subunit